MPQVTGGGDKIDPAAPQIEEKGRNKPESGVNEAYITARALAKSFDEFKASTPLFNEAAWVDTMDTGVGRDTPSFLLTGKMIDAGLVLDGARDAYLSHKKGGRDALSADETVRVIIECRDEALVVFNEAKAVLAESNKVQPTKSE